jgi:hypothetical protein
VGVIASLGIMLAAFAAPPASKPATEVCSKLAKEFESNERTFAMIHDLNASLLKIEQDFQATMAPFEQQVAIEEARLRALGGVPRPSAPTVRSGAGKVAEARSKMERDDEKFKAEDRITTLLIANRCTPPDHVTSWFTYSKTNPNAPK